MTRSLAASLCFAAAVLVLGHPRAVVEPRSVRAHHGESMLRRLRFPLSCLGFAAGWAYLGGLVGVVAGGGVAIWTWRTLSRAQSPAERQREERLRADYPLVVELLAAALAAGSDVSSALAEVADAVGEPWRGRVQRWLNALDVGQPPSAVWALVEADPIAPALGRTLARSQATGVPVAEAMRRLAADLREESELAALAFARTIEVRAAVPLGVCFLPSFILLGVVPLVVGILRGFTWETGS